MTVIANRDGVRAEHVLVPLPDTGPNEARLSFDNGLERVNLRTGDDAGALLTAAFGEPLPAVWVADWNVHVEYPLGSRVFRRHHPSSLWLNPAVPWSLDVHGGASEWDADLTDIDVRSVTLHSGAAHIRLTLGRPSRARTIRVGAVKDLRIERPAGVPVRLEMAKGATKVALDDRRFGAVGGGLLDHTGGYDPDQPHYAVTVAGGADTVTISEIGE